MCSREYGEGRGVSIRPPSRDMSSLRDSGPDHGLASFARDGSFTWMGPRGYGTPESPFVINEAEPSHL